MADKEWKLRIARVFPTKTNMCPTDPDAYFGSPDLFTPKYDEVHISVTFTWDIEKAKRLKRDWEKMAKKVFFGGPVFDRGDKFVSGMYLKKGVTITSRGCPNNCRFCFVPQREGKIRELPIMSGNIIQDNNLLACSKQHLRKVFAMFKTQRHIDFSGGLESRRITNEIVEQLRGLRIYQMWLSYDMPEAKISVLRATERLKKYFKRDKIRCYVLIGYKGDTTEKATERLRWAFSIGTLPFAMRYRTPDPKWQGTYLFKERVWNLLQRQWTRPAIMKSIMQEKT